MREESEAEGRRAPLAVAEGSLPLPFAVVEEPLKRNQTLMHALLIEQAAQWLAKSERCTVVITEMVTGASETPDAIGWKGSWSTLVECKASRSDFLADRHKFFRREPERGMGDSRYYAAPAGMIKAAELPDGWGLLEWNGKRLKAVVKSQNFRSRAINTGGASLEKCLLVSALRLVAVTAPKGVSVKCYVMESKGCATLGIVPEQPLPTTANASTATPQQPPTSDEGGLPQ